MVAFALAAALFGCASANGDGAGDEAGDEPATTAASQGDDDTPRPAFDASIDGEGDTDDGGAPDPGDPDPNPPGGGDECIDNNDPGGAENVAKALANQTDCDNSAKTIKGVLNGPVDVDYYRMTVTDKFGCSIDTDFESATSGPELCVFVKCTNGTTTHLKSCKSGVQKTSDIGMLGCCSSLPGKAIPDWDCGGITDNDSADMFIRVKQTANQCLPYTVDYHF